MIWGRNWHTHRRRTVFLLLPLLWALAMAAGWGATSLQLATRIDKLLYDQRVRWTMPQTPDERIAIVDIDERSLAALGQWPWPRNRLAQLVDELFKHQHIAVLGMDLVFVEKDASSGSEVVQRLAREDLSAYPDLAMRLKHLESQFDHDAQFAAALKNRPVVLGYYFSSDAEGHQMGRLPRSVLRPADLGPNRAQMTHWKGFGANIDVLAQAAPRAGFFNALTDVDGVVRSLPVLAEMQGGVYESLALAVLRTYWGDAHLRTLFPSGAWQPQNQPTLQGLRIESGVRRVDVPLDGRASALVPYRGVPGARAVHPSAFNYVSAVDLLGGKVAADTLKGRIVLLGSTTPGLQDQRPTPLQASMPGVEIHAHLLSGLLDGRLTVEPDYAAGFNVLQLLLVGLMLAWWLPRLNLTQSLSLGAVTAVAVMAFNYWAFASQRLVLPVALALVLTAMTTMLNIAYGFFVERYVRRRVTDWFGTYVPQDVVHEMVDRDEGETLAISREMTVMFCDIRGFTAMAESMSTLDIQALLSDVFTRQTRIIHANSGTVDKYMGDCVMAFWGAPKPDPLHATHATAAALAIVDDMAQWNQARAARGEAPVHVGIGIATGVMSAGDMGSDIRRNYTVIGDSVNLASRLQDLTKAYRVDILASETTRQQDTAHQWQAVDTVRVTGRNATERVFKPTGLKAAPVAEGQT